MNLKIFLLAITIYLLAINSLYSSEYKLNILQPHRLGFYMTININYDNNDYIAIVIAGYYRKYCQKHYPNRSADSMYINNDTLFFDDNPILSEFYIVTPNKDIRAEAKKSKERFISHYFIEEGNIYSKTPDWPLVISYMISWGYYVYNGSYSGYPEYSQGYHDSTYKGN